MWGPTSRGATGRRKLTLIICLAAASFGMSTLTAAPALAAPRGAVAVLTATGDTYTWTGSGSTTDWSDAGNWTCSGSGCIAGSTPVIDSPSDVVFPASPLGGEYKPTIDQSVEVNTLSLQSTGYDIGGSGALTVDGATNLEGEIATTADQTYDGPVTVAGNETDEIVTGSGVVTFNGTVNGTAAGAEGLMLQAATVFNAPVGNSAPLWAIGDNGWYSKTFNTAQFSVVGGVLFSGPVTLEQDTTISGNTLRFGPTDGAYSMTADGSTEFTGPVGGTTPPTQLTVNGSATFQGDVTTTGAQTYTQTAGIWGDHAATTFTGSTVSFAGSLSGNGGPITIDGSATLADGGDQISDLSATGSLSITGGTLEMTGNLEVGGTLDATGGSVNLDGDGTQQLQASDATFGSLNISGGSTLDLDGTSTNVADLSGGGNLTDSGGAATFTAAPSGNDSYGGAISGPISLTMDGTGSLDLLGALGWSGSTTVSSGTLTFSSDPANLTGITDEGQVGFDLPGDSTYGGIISGTGGVTQSGSGTLTLNGANSYSGTTTVDDGLIRFFNPGNLGTSNITLNGGGLQWGTDNSSDISDRLNPIGPKGGTIDTGGNQLMFLTSLTGTGGMTVTGSGLLILNADATYSGATNVESGELDIWDSLAGALNVESGADATVTGTVYGPVAVDQGTLSCENGTLDGGPVANDGGTLNGAPGAPTGVWATGGSHQATVGFNAGNANCYPLSSYTVTASPGSETATGSGSPITVTGLSDNTSYTFTVTATNPIGSTTSQPSAAVLTAAGAPTASINSPTSGNQYTLNQTVPTSFSCSDAAGGPGIATCVDSHGAMGGTGELDTTTLGLHVYIVTATSKDGQDGASTISYTVVSPPPSPPPPPPPPPPPALTPPQPAPRPPSNAFTLAPFSSAKPLVNSCGVARLRLTLPGPGAVKLVETAAPTASVFGRAEAVAARAEALRLTVKPNRHGARLVKRHRRVRLTIKVSFTPSGGANRVVTKHIRIRGMCPAPR